MIGFLTIGLIGLALCKKKRSVSGIGKVERVKRRIYKEIAVAQSIRFCPICGVLHIKKSSTFAA